jgi:glycosyltransferase involved in cell wall biosynthesis
VRIPYRALGHLRAFDLHDRLVAHSLRRVAGEIDLVHTWPLGARRTLLAARDLGIPTVLERPNAHTRFAMETVREESLRIGVTLPPNHEHAYNEDLLHREEIEYELADRLLCPSEFVAGTFVDEGYPRAKLARHVYGYDPGVFHPPQERRSSGDGLKLLFVGVCAVRKGLHFALEAWLDSPACETGTFSIAGSFLPSYADKLADKLDHPSVRVLGHRTDVPDLMREHDALVLPSIEEGFPLACVEAIGSGCVPLVSTACSEACVHGETGFVHKVGETEELSGHITVLAEDPDLLERMRTRSLESSSRFTWGCAGERLLQVYREAVASSSTKRR